MIDKEKIIEEFKRINSLGFVKSRRKHNTGIGKTFEDYLGVDENNKKDPDFAGFEVKTQRQVSKSYITLFTKSPSFPKSANTILKETFGRPDKKLHDIKVLHTSIFGNKFNTYDEKYGFKLLVEKDKEKIYLITKFLDNGKVINSDIYWSFKDLRNSIDKKLRALFVVLAETKKINEIEFFHYTNAKVFLGFDFKSFVKAITDGNVMFDIRLGAYKTSGSKSYGKPHDHGSGFRVHREYLPNLFEEIFEIK